MSAATSDNGTRSYTSRPPRHAATSPPAARPVSTRSPVPRTRCPAETGTAAWRAGGNAAPAPPRRRCRGGEQADKRVMMFVDQRIGQRDTVVSLAVGGIGLEPCGERVPIGAVGQVGAMRTRRVPRDRLPHLLVLVHAQLPRRPTTFFVTPDLCRGPRFRARNVGRACGTVDAGTGPA